MQSFGTPVVLRELSFPTQTGSFESLEKIMARRTLRYESLETRILMAADAGIVPTDLSPAPTVPSEIGMLLPAIQKVRDAAAHGDPETPENLGVESPEPEGILIGMLLPAIQKVRDGDTQPEFDLKGQDSLPEPGGSGEQTYLAVKLENVQITRDEFDSWTTLPRIVSSPSWNSSLAMVL
jgi:hypothetical protein